MADSPPRRKRAPRTCPAPERLRHRPHAALGQAVLGVRVPFLLLLALVVAACDEAPGPDGEPPSANGAPDADAPAAGTEPEAPDRAFAGMLAITIDDLPWVGPLPPGETRIEATRRILAALERHDVPATGFVNCGRSEPGAPVLRRWLDAGRPLGNHTSEHLDLNQASVDAWVADARECDGFLRELTGRPSVPFRYPYLHRGQTLERYRAGRAALDSLDSRIAPVTINTADWVLDDPYVAALRADEAALAAEIRAAYVDHVARAAEHYEQAARERVGRGVAHILLLHSNALLADQLDALLERLRAEGFRFVPLARALEDPVYDREDDYIGPNGLSWLYRFEPAMPGGHSWYVGETARLRNMVR